MTKPGRNALIVHEARQVKTVGMDRLGQSDFAIPFLLPTLSEAALKLAEYLVSYIEDDSRLIRAGETMAWATSVLRFNAVGDELVVSSLNVKRDEFDETADNALLNWNEQRAVCSAASSAYVQTQLIEMMVVSPDVEAGGPLDHGVRYSFNPPNSGWWIFGLKYTGGIETMRRIHVGDVVQSCPGLTTYLALEPGFCFSLIPDPRVWFEEEVAKQPPV